MQNELFFQTDLDLDQHIIDIVEFKTIFAFFMQIWKKFDTDCSGFIEANELKNFIKELLKISDHISIVSEDDLIAYADTMVSVKSA